MISVWRNTEETTSFLMVYLFWMVKELEKDERSKRKRLKQEERIRRESENLSDG
jgi:hypothetical protein